MVIERDRRNWKVPKKVIKPPVSQFTVRLDLKLVQCNLCKKSVPLSNKSMDPYVEEEVRTFKMTHKCKSK